MGRKIPTHSNRAIQRFCKPRQFQSARTRIHPERRNGIRRIHPTTRRETGTMVAASRGGPIGMIGMMLGSLPKNGRVSGCAAGISCFCGEGSRAAPLPKKLSGAWALFSLYPLFSCLLFAPVCSKSRKQNPFFKKGRQFQEVFPFAGGR